MWRWIATIAIVFGVAETGRIFLWLLNQPSDGAVFFSFVLGVIVVAIATRLINMIWGR